MSEREVYQGRLFTIIEKQVREFDGRERLYEYVRRADTIAVLITHPEKGVLLLDEVQPGGVMREASLVYGKILPGEDPPHAAIREVREEVGLEGRISWLFSIQPCGKSILWHIHQFILRDAIIAGPSQREPGERIREAWYAYDTFLSLLWEKRLNWETLQLGLLFLLQMYGRDDLIRFLKEGDDHLLASLQAFLRSWPQS